MFDFTFTLTINLVSNYRQLLKSGTEINSLSPRGFVGVMPAVNRGPKLSAAHLDDE